MAERIYGVVGRRLSYSYSVPIHHALGNENYQLIEVEPSELAAFLHRGDIGGLNVTIPYKRDVIPYLDALSETAQRIGSVNTIVRRADGSLWGDNTDAAGLTYLIRQTKLSLFGKKVVVFGSGGASLTVQAVARQAHAREVVVISRSGVENYAHLDRHFDADILINATPLGMAPYIGEMPADPGAFARCQGVIDLAYNPAKTAFLQRAEAQGIPHANGLSMLVHQAKEAEARFRGCAIPDDETVRVERLIRRDTENIVLIGMPGSGKTTIGRILAAHTGREAVDIDARIEALTGQTIATIFSEKGESAFRAFERAETARVGQLSGKIIMTGGGVVTDERNYRALHQNGRIYHIERPLWALARKGRPLSTRANLAQLYTQRAPQYARFRDVAIVNRRTPEWAAAQIWREFCDHMGT